MGPNETPASGAREAWGAALGFLVLSFAFSYPAGLSATTFMTGGDGVYSYFPYVLRSFRPVSPEVGGAWDPTLFTGLPESHTPCGRYYPPTVVLYTLLPAATAFCLAIVLHHALAGLGAYLLGRSGGLSRTASWLAGLVFGFGGFLVFHRGHVPMHEAGAWLPWVLWALERFRARGTAAWAVLAGTFMAVQALTGFLQLVVIGAMVWLTWLTYFAVAEPGGGVRRGRLLLGGVAACLLGAAGSLPQMLPMLEVSRWSGYGAFNLEFFRSGNLKVRFLAGLVGPWVLGGGFGAPTGGHYWGLTEHGIFYGVLPLTAAIVGLLSNCGLRIADCESASRNQRFWLILLVGSLLLMLGDNAPLHPLLAHVPVYRLFHVPARHVWVFGLALGWLAGLALDRMRQAEAAVAGRLLRRSAVVMVMLAAACAAMVLTAPDWPGRPGWNYPGFWIPVGSAAAALACLFVLARFGRRRAWVAALVPMFAFVELRLNIGEYSLGPGAPTALTNQDAFPEVVRWLHAQAADGLPPRCLIQPESWRVAGRSWPVPSTFGSAWGLGVLNSYSQSMPRSLARLLRLDAYGNAEFLRVLREERGLSAAGGRFILANKPLAGVDHGPGHPGSSAMLRHGTRQPYQLVARFEPDLCVYENRQARGLATLVSEVRPADSDVEAAEAIITPGPPVRDLAYVVAPGGSSSGWALAGPVRFAPGKAELRPGRPDDVLVHTSTAGDGFLVLAVTRCRGWSATVDGTETPIHAVDGPLMGVRVPAGEHVVRFRFRPVLAEAGMAAAVTGLGGAWLVLAAAGLRKRRRKLAAGQFAGPPAADLAA